MLIIAHGVNTIEKLKNISSEYGIEVDLRPWGDKVILHHEPFIEGEDFAEFLRYYHHAFIILNVKSEGIERKCIQLMNEFNIENYFLLDVTPPFIFKLANQGIKKIAVRFSEWECIETCLAMKGKVDWIFIDNLTRLPIENQSFQKLRKYFKLCFVSPELLKRDEVEETKKILQNNPADAVLTDNPGKWKQ